MSFQFDFDDSDLTELESDDEPGTPLLVQSQAAKAAAAKAKAAETKKAAKDINPPRLKECYHKTMSPDNLYRYLQEEVINLNPEYQRDVVWTDTNQGYLIDSLMHNYAVFPLIFAVRPREDGVEEMICIDGKQRITAIQQFMDCKISYRDSQLNREMWYKTVPQAKTAKNVISPAQRQRFNLMNIAIYEYKHITEHEEREIFQRVQNAVALTAHERLRAYNGFNADLVRDMHRKTSDELRQFFHWDKAKGKDFFMLSQIAILINHHLSARKGQYPATELKLNRVETFLHGKTAPTPKLRSATLGVIDTLNCLIRHPEWREPFTTIQPMWFVMSVFMIHMYRGKYSCAQLADAVRQMEEMVKAKTAAKAYKDLGVFVVNKVPSLKLKGDGKGDRPASSITFDGHLVESQPVTSTTTTTAKVTPKRKRGASVSDTESEWDEEDEAPKKKAVSARRKKPCLPESDDDDDDYQVVSTSPRTKTAAARTSVKKLVSTKITGTRSAPASKATTTVKRTTTKAGTSTAAVKVPAKASTSASVKETLLSSRVGKPSIKPSAMKAKKPMASCPATPSPAQVTPPASRSPMPPPLPSTSTSAPLPVSRPGLATRPLNPSRPTTPLSGSTRPSPFDRVKVEPRHSPAIPADSMLPQSMSQAPFHSDRHPLADRLAPLRAAMARVAADNTLQQQQQPSPSVSASCSGSSMSMSISSTSSGSGPGHWQHQHQQQQQFISDPRRRPPSASSASQPQPPPPTNDDDTELLAQLDVIESELRVATAPAFAPLTPAPSTSPTPALAGMASAPHAVPPARQRPQASTSTDVVMADGTKEVLANVQPIGRRPVAAHAPARSLHAGPAPRPSHINSNVDEYRSTSSASASGVSATRGQPGRTPTSSVDRQPLSAPLPGSGSNGSFSVKGMPPIPRLPSQQPQTPTMSVAAAPPRGPASMREKGVGSHGSKGHQDWERGYWKDSKYDNKYKSHRPEY